MSNFYFSNIEIIIIFFLIIVITFPLRLINRKNNLSILNPLIIYSLLISYYVLITPIYRVITENTINRGIDYRDLFIYGWVGALLSLLSIYIGYFLTPNFFKKYRKCNLSNDQLWKIGFYICLFGYVMILIAYPLQFDRFNPFIRGDNTSFDFLLYKGVFQNYLLYLENLPISGSLLIINSYIRNKKRPVLTSIFTIISFGLLLNAGFRYKLFFLMFPTFLVYAVTKKFGPKIYTLFFFLGITFIVILNSFLEIIRTYGGGFRLSNLKNFNFLDIIVSLFTNAESSVFLTTSGLMSIVPEKINYLYLYPLYKVIIHPIPSGLLPNKNPGDYITDSLRTFFSSDVVARGAAIHNFGEYYLMFGWVGIVVISLFLGYLLKKLWLWVLIHNDEPIALPLYCLNLSFIFMIISRGYLPQQFNLYIFSVFPLVLVYLINSKKLKKINYP